MNIFWRKQKGITSELTDDPILKKYKFTNVYRATDRVSQYLIKDVIYSAMDSCKPEDMILRIIIFKVFNKIETWEFLKDNIEEITIENYDPSYISEVLTRRRATDAIFNNAYMMTGTHHLYNTYKYKHEKWLWMIKREIVEKNICDRVLKTKSLEELYELLHQCSFLGDFLSYQYAIDINYTPYLNFSEDSFVRAGVGAIRGIKKCFDSYGNEYEDAIRYVQLNFSMLQERYGYSTFIPLPNHMPTLLDLQNCFCETDKYLREKLPQLKVGNVRIKQKYKATEKPINFFFPTNWNVVI